MKKFNGEIKAYREAALAVKEFESKNAEVLAQMEELKKIFTKAEEKIKTVAKEIVAEKGEELKDVINGVNINAYYVNKRVFDLKDKDLTNLLDLGILGVELKPYDKAVEEGKLLAFHTEELNYTAVKVKLEE